MKPNRRRRRPAGRGEAAGAAAILAAAGLAGIDPRLAAVPLTLFVLACLAAPFLPALGFFLPVVTRGRAGSGAVALTFDDGPDPRTTPVLLDLLRRRGIRAAFFVTGRRAAAHPDLVRAIRREGHAVGNHSYRHDPLLMLRGRRAIAREIDRTAAVLAALGIRTPFFRPPVGIVGPDLGPVLRKRGMVAVTYNRRAVDGGNRRVGHISLRILGRVRPGDIVMLHDTAPPDERKFPLWREEIERLLGGLARKGIAVRPLAEVVGPPTVSGGNFSSTGDRRPADRR